MIIVFSNSRSTILKSTKLKHSWSQIQAFLFLHEILILGKLEDADFKYDNIFFKFHSKNTQIRHFWSQIQKFLFFLKSLQLDKFEGADFKYDNLHFPKFGPKFRKFYYFHEILQLDKFEGADFKYDNILFKFPPKNAQIEHFWSQF